MYAVCLAARVSPRAHAAHGTAPTTLPDTRHASVPYLCVYLAFPDSQGGVLGMEWLMSPSHHPFDPSIPSPCFCVLQREMPQLAIDTTPSLPLLLASSAGGFRLCNPTATVGEVRQNRMGGMGWPSQNSHTSCTPYRLFPRRDFTESTQCGRTGLIRPPMPPYRAGQPYIDRCRVL